MTRRNVLRVAAAAGLAGVGAIALPDAVRLAVRLRPDWVLDDGPTRVALEQRVEQASRDAERARIADLLAGEFADLARAGALPAYLGAHGYSRRILYFTDYACAGCREMDERVRLAASDAATEVVYVLVPLGGAASAMAARAAVATHLWHPAAFESVHRALMAAPLPTTVAGLSALLSGAGARGLRLDAALGDPRVLALVRRGEAFARAVGVRALPAWLIESTLVDGARSARELLQRMREIRASASTPG